MVADTARGGARQADAELARGKVRGPLHGVPFTVKDSFETAGVISTAGTQGWAKRIPAEDATIVARIRAAGAILLGKTNTPEFTWSDETDNLVYGRTSNPYDLTRTPGGSSGGPAAILASGGSDAPVERGEPMIEFYAAVSRKDQKGFSGEGWHPEQAVSREQALKMFTIWAAYAAFEEKLKGSLEIGKLADMTVLSADIMKIAEPDILRTRCLMTVIGGGVVYESGSN